MLQKFCSYVKQFLLSQYLLVIAILAIINHVSMESKICGTLFSGEDFDGDEFNLNDWDQSVNTYKDYRSLLSGWRNTSSIVVEENCTLTICDGTYFEGGCREIPGGNYQANQSTSDIRSVSCNCSKVCQCGEITIPQNPAVCGRAYLNKTCSQCDSGYLPIMYYGHYYNTPAWPNGSVDTVLIRQGCTLTTFSKTNMTGTKRVITGGIIQGLKERTGSYFCKCKENSLSSIKRKFRSKKARKRPKLSGNKRLRIMRLSRPSLSLLRASKRSKLSSRKRKRKKTSSNASLSFLQGRNTTRKSLQLGRSPSVYIIIFGVERTAWIGLQGCPLATKNIGECYIKVRVDEIRRKEIELGIIYISFGALKDQINDDARWLATLDLYLSTHPHLKNSIPNAVIVYHSPLDDTSVFRTQSKFQRKLSAINALRGRLLDESYSNLIFLLQAKKPERNPDAQLDRFEDAIRKYWKFPEPLVLVPRGTIIFEQALRINGHCQMESGEYFFKNLYEKLLLACEKAGDDLGYAVFKAVLPFEETNWKFGNKSSIELLPANDTKVEIFREIYAAKTHSNYALQLHKTEVDILSEKLNTKIEIANKTLYLGEPDVKKELLSLEELFQKHVEFNDDKFSTLEEKNNELEQELREHDELSATKISLLEKENLQLREQKRAKEDQVAEMGSEIEILTTRMKQVELEVNQQKYSLDRQLKDQGQNLTKALEIRALETKKKVFDEVMSEMQKLNAI